MSIYHKDKAGSLLEVKEFSDQVKVWLTSLGVKFGKVLCLRAYGGEVRVYPVANTTIERRSLRKGNKRVMVSTDLMEVSTGPVLQKNYYPFYREEFENDKAEGFMRESILAFFNNNQ